MRQEWAIPKSYRKGNSIAEWDALSKRDQKNQDAMSAGSGNVNAKRWAGREELVI